MNPSMPLYVRDITKLFLSKVFLRNVSFLVHSIHICDNKNMIQSWKDDQESEGCSWRWALPTSLWLTLAEPQNVNAWMWCDHLAFALRLSAAHMEACHSLSPVWIKENMLNLPHKSHGIWILPSFLSSIWYHLPSCVPAVSLTTKTLPSCSRPHGTYFCIG